MSLDLFNRNLDESVAYAARASAPDLPVDFSHGMSDAWNTGYLTGQSISGQIRQQTARSQLIEDAIAKTGDTSLGQFHGEGGGFDVDGYNQRLAAIKGQRPDLDVQPLSNEAVQARADEIGKGALEESARTGSREYTTGGRVGSFLGSTGAALADPVNLIAFPLAAPEALGILGTSMAWAAIGGGSQVAIEALNSTAMERIKPGYSESSEPVTNILAAAGFSGAIGGGLKGLSNTWTRYKTGAWPRSIRDAGNVVDSEAQIASTNIMPGVEGEVAHRAAMSKAIDDIVAGRPVDVDGIVPPEAFLAREASFDPVIAARTATREAEQAAATARDEAVASGKPQADLPFVPTAQDAAAELHLQTVADGVQKLAAMAGHEMPIEEAAQIARRFADMPDQQVRQLLDEIRTRPATIADTLPAVEKPSKGTVKTNTGSPDALRALADDVTPERIAELRTEPEMADTISRDLDRLRAEKGDFEIPTGVTKDADGNTIAAMRKVEDVMAEVEARELASQELMSCVGPYPKEAAE